MLGGIAASIVLVVFLLIVGLWILYFATTVVYRMTAPLLRGTAIERRFLQHQYPRGCNICGAFNRPGHGCHVHAYAQRGTKLPNGGFITSQGVRKEWRWNGWVRDRSSAIWGCRHDHWTQKQARDCAKGFVRQLQRAIVLDDITTPHPFTFHVQRVPIADLSRAEWDAMKRDANYSCHYCGAPSQILQKEHRIPLSRGGLNSIANIVPSCALCNFRKGVLTDIEYFDKLKREAEREARLATPPQARHS